MASYSDLKPDQYYLIQESGNSSLELVFVLMHSEKAVLVEYLNPQRVQQWFRKSDSFHEVVEQFSEETANVYSQLHLQEEVEDEAEENDEWPDDEDGDDFNEFWNKHQDDPDLPFKN